MEQQRNEVEYYTNLDITDEVLDRMKKIAALKYRNDESSVIIKNIIESLDSVCYGVLDEECVNIILGQDWFLIYSGNKSEVVIEVWVANDENDNKFMQTMEMYSEFKKVLCDCEGKVIFASMKEDTSYKFYKKMEEKAYLETFCEEVTLASYAPSEYFEDVCMRYGSFDAFLEVADSDEMLFNNIKGYIFHDVDFGVTDKFVKQYRK